MSGIRVTRKTARLLRALLSVHAGRELAARSESMGPFRVSSAALMRQARLGVGSFYPLIARLEDAGWVEGEWEELPDDCDRPRRLYYHLTEEGVHQARRAGQEDDRRKPWWKRLGKFFKEMADGTSGDD